MPIKKSAILFLLLTIGSFCLLAFAANKSKAATIIPGDCTIVKCVLQNNTSKAFAPWMIISKLLFPAGA